MKNIFTFLLCLAFSISWSQELEVQWKVLLGGTDTDAGHDIIYTRDGGFMIAASSNSNDGEVSAGHGDYDIWMIKLSYSGQVEWSKTYGGSDWEWPNSVIQTSDDGYLVVGFTHSDDGDISGFHSFRDGWVVKLSSSGEIQWERSMGGSDAETLSDVIEVSDGYIVVGSQHSVDGDLTGQNCNSDFWVIKLDFDGNTLWQKCFGGTGLDVATSLAKNYPGGFVVGGYTDSNDGDVTGYHDSYDYWVVAIDDNGELLWQKTLGGSSWDQAFDIAYDGMLHNMYIVGESLSTDGDISINHGDTDYWVVCLDANGNMIFEKSFGGSGEEHATSVLLYNWGKEIFIVGSASSSDGDVEGNHGNHDMWVLNTTRNGTVNWSKCFGGTRFEKILSTTHSIDENQIPDGIVLVGHTNSDDGDVEGLKGSDDVWVIKLGDASTSVDNPLSNTGNVSIYPNPVRDFITISSDVSNQRVKRIIIYDVMGRKLMTVPVDAFSLTLNLGENLTLSGIYFVEVQLGSGQKMVKKMVLK